MDKFSKRLCLVAVIFGIMLGISYISAALRNKSVATATKVEGTTEVKRVSDTEWYPVVEGMGLQDGDHVKTNKDGYLEIVFDNSVVVKLEDSSRLVITPSKDKTETRLELSVGKLLLNVPKLVKFKCKLDVLTPTAVASVRGTEFVVDVEDTETTNVGVFDGMVTVKSFTDTGKLSDDELVVKPGEQTMVKFGKLPMKPHSMGANMVVQRERITILRQHAESYRARLPQIMTNREQIESKVNRLWNNIQEERTNKIKLSPTLQEERNPTLPHYQQRRTGPVGK